MSSFQQSAEYPPNPAVAVDNSRVSSGVGGSGRRLRSSTVAVTSGPPRRFSPGAQNSPTRAEGVLSTSAKDGETVIDEHYVSEIVHKNKILDLQVRLLLQQKSNLNLRVSILEKEKATLQEKVDKVESDDKRVSCESADSTASVNARNAQRIAELESKVAVQEQTIADLIRENRVLHEKHVALATTYTDEIEESSVRSRSGPSSEKSSKRSSLLLATQPVVRTTMVPSFDGVSAAAVDEESSDGSPTTPGAIANRATFPSSSNSLDEAADAASHPVEVKEDSTPPAVDPMSLALDLKGSVKIGDRKYAFTTYKNVFVASEAVKWLVEDSRASSSVKAVEILEMLVKEGLIEHARQKNKAVENSLQFFKFCDRVLDAPEGSFTENDICKSDGNASGMESNAVVEDEDPFSRKAIESMDFSELHRRVSIAQSPSAPKTLPVDGSDSEVDSLKGRSSSVPGRKGGAKIGEATMLQSFTLASGAKITLYEGDMFEVDADVYVVSGNPNRDGRRLSQTMQFADVSSEIIPDAALTGVGGTDEESSSTISSSIYEIIKQVAPVHSAGMQPNPQVVSTGVPIVPGALYFCQMTEDVSRTLNKAGRVCGIKQTRQVKPGEYACYVMEIDVDPGYLQVAYDRLAEIIYKLVDGVRDLGLKTVNVYNVLNGAFGFPVTHGRTLFAFLLDRLLLALSKKSHRDATGDAQQQKSEHGAVGSASDGSPTLRTAIKDLSVNIFVIPGTDPEFESIQTEFTEKCCKSPTEKELRALADTLTVQASSLSSLDSNSEPVYGRSRKHTLVAVRPTSLSVTSLDMPKIAPDSLSGDDLAGPAEFYTDDILNCGEVYHAVDDSEEVIEFYDDSHESGEPAESTPGSTEQWRDIRCATLDKLVERLTYHGAYSSNYLYGFLLAYRSFTTPQELLNKLIERYNVRPSGKRLRDVTIGEFVEFRKTKLERIRLRVCMVLNQWIAKHAYDFVDDDKLKERLLNFLNETVAKTRMLKTAETLKNILQRRIAAADAEETSEVLALNPVGNVSKDPFADFSAEEIAEQLTLMDHQLFRHIQPKELLNQNWKSETRREKAPNLDKTQQRFNEVSFWLASQVLRYAKLQDRKNALKKVIKIGEQFRHLNNFNGVLEVVSGLSSAAVYRLRKTWDALSAKTVAAYEELRVLVSGEGNFRKLRETLPTVKPPKIPYIGLYLTDLLHIEDGNDDTLRGKINFNKRRLIANLIKSLQVYQHNYYSIQSVPTTQFSLLHLNSLDEDERYRASLDLEPRESH